MKEKPLSIHSSVKIKETLELMLDVFLIDTVYIISLSNITEIQLEISTSIASDDIQLQPADEILKSDIIKSTDISKGLFISNIAAWLLEHQPKSNFISNTKSFFALPFQIASENKVVYICMSHSTNRMLNNQEKALFSVFKENIENEWKRTISKNNPQNHNIESEEKFKVIFDAVPEAISFHELPSHRTVAVNKAFISYSGYSEDEILGATGVELNLWHDEKNRLEYRDLLLKHGKVSNFSAQFRSKSGLVFHGLVSDKIVQFSGKKYLLVIIRNIDLLINAQVALQESEKKFKLVFDSLPDSVTINKMSDMTFTEVNNHFMETVGMKRDELIGKSGFELNMWAKPEQREYYINQIQEHGGIDAYRMKFSHRNGKDYHGLISATTIQINDEPHLLVVTKNIDQIIKIKEKLSISEEKFKMFFESSPDAININTYEEALFVDVNDSFLAQTHYTKEDLIGKSIFDFDFWLNEQDLQTFLTILNEKKEVHNLETQYRLKDGSIINCLVSAAISNINGVPHIITITRNIEEIKQVLQVLEESESRFRTIVEKSHASISIIDDNYKFVYLNPKSTELFGYEYDELINQNFKKVIHPDSLSLVTGRYKQRQADLSTPEQYEFQIIRKDGQIRDVEIRSSIFKDKNNHTRTIAQLLDITQIKKAIKTAKLNEEKAQNYLDVSAVMLLAFNQTGEVEMANKKACEILEYSENEILGKNWFEHFLPANNQEHTKRIYNEIFKGRKIIKYSENLVVTKNGEERMIAWYNSPIKDEFGQVTGVLSSGEDITEKIKNQSIIKENEERYRTIFDGNMDGMVILDTNGTIVEVNQVICQMYGYSYDEFMNRDENLDLHIVSNYDFETVRSYLLSNDIFQTESEDTRKNGSSFVIHVKIRWIKYNNDNHLLAIIRDITEKKDSELALIEAKEKAEESDTLKSAFLANMSHEIRTPMNAIIGFAGLLDEEDLEEDEQKDFVSRIRNNGTMLLSLINDIIDISKIEANQINLQFAHIDIEEFFKSLYDTFSFEAEKKQIDFVCKHPEILASNDFMTDINRLRQIMVNLLSNAIKFTPTEGEIEFGYTILDDLVTFHVKDNGIGISKDEQKFMFNRFRQAHAVIENSSYGGTGLGLSISRGLVTKMGGRIWIDSEPDKGSTFYFTLPCNPAL